MDGVIVKNQSLVLKNPNRSLRARASPNLKVNPRARARASPKVKVRVRNALPNPRVRNNPRIV